MSNEADSRDTTPTVRWSETAAEVPSANITEPSGGVKNVGWVPGVSRPNGNWWNWLHWADGVFHRYVENLLELLWPLNQMMPGGVGGAVSAGVGLSVDVTRGQAWIQGAFYKIPAVTNLALDTAGLLHPRIDLIVGQVSGGLSEWAVITGTPHASPATPTPSAGQVAVAHVRVNALAVVPTAITDDRTFGLISLDDITAVKNFAAGDLGGGDSMVTIDQAGVNLGNGQVIVTETVVTVEPESFFLASAIVRKLPVGAAAFAEDAGTPTRLSSGSGWSGGIGDSVIAPVPLQRGAVITDVRVWGTKAAVNANLVLSLQARDKVLGTVTYTEGPVDNDGTPTGDFELAIGGLSISVGDQPDQLAIRVLFDDTGGVVQLYGAEVEYTLTKPFDGL